ncbi:MAG TPA: AMP-binding protein [Candidatus Binatia bacterium]|nr:AMP-binding protein [Candidatus Binatia bacterium]
MHQIRPTERPARAAAYVRDGWWRDETIWDALVATTAQHAARTALIEGDMRLTFRDLVERADALASGLSVLGIAAGDAVAFQLPNWWETVVVLLAVARAGAVGVPILPIHRQRELVFILRQTHARVLIVPGRYRDCDHRELAGALRPELPDLADVIVVRDSAAPGMRTLESIQGTSGAPTAPGAPPDVALVIYTSGTTADPKGVLHSHQTLLAEARSLAPVHDLSSRDVVLMPSPLTHISGIVHALLVPASLGSCAVLMPRWDATEALGLIAAEHVTYMVGAPTFLRELAQHPGLRAADVRSFRLFSCGGADVDPTLIAEAADRLGCVAKRVYGSTEFPTITTTGPDDPPARRVDSEGRAIGAVEVRLVGDDDAAVPAGREGEILARGPECFLGYLDGALNADSFTTDGWFRTGDLATLDEAGYLRITGRKKDIIIRKGENISARELEDLVAAHPSVAEVAVVGLPDLAAGEIACAAVRLRPGHAALSLADVTAHLLARGLSKRKLPERLVVADDFPRTASGKVLKRALRERLASER